MQLHPALTAGWADLRAHIPVEAVLAASAGIALLVGYSLGPPAAVPAYFLAMVLGAIAVVPEAWISLRKGRMDVHLLMLTAAVGAAGIGSPGEGAVLLFLFTLSAALEAFAMGRTRDAIRRLVKMRPTTARRDDGELVPVESLVPGDVFVVHPGEAFPLDGEVLDGVSFVDQSTMTGESEPVSRRSGDRVVSGTINIDGRLIVRATSSSADSSLERVIQLVAEAHEEKSLASSERLADRVGRFYAPLVLVGSFGWFVGMVYIAGQAAEPAMYRALTLLVAASPCALVLSSPAAILSALAAAARKGILVRNGAVLESLARIDTLAFDKTGTLTSGHPHVVDIWAASGDTTRILAIAAAVEEPSSHPLAVSLVQAAENRGIRVPTAVNHRSVPGMGAEAMVDGADVRVGRPEWIDDPRVRERIEEARAAGRSVVVVASSEEIGFIAFEDSIRPDAQPALGALSSLRVANLVLLTGDHRQAAAPVAARLGFSDIRAGLTPEGKVSAIRSFVASGKALAMVGDGVNDAPALASATVGITLGGIGSDVALDSADVVIMDDRLGAVAEVIALARQARAVALQNVTVSLLGVVLLSAFVVLQGVPLPLAVVFHEGTTVVVVLNGVRLLWQRRQPLRRHGPVRGRSPAAKVSEASGLKQSNL